MLASRYSNTDSNIETIKLLLQNGANPNLKNSNGGTALMLTLLQLKNIKNSIVFDNIIEIINLFIKYGYDLNIKNNGNNTILMQILNNKIINVNAVKTLLNHSVNINIKNKNNESALILASKNPNINKEILSELIFYDINIDEYYEYKNGEKKLFIEFIKNNKLKHSCIEFLHIIYHHKICMKKVMKELLIKINDIIYRPSSIRTRLFFAYKDTKNIHGDNFITNYLNIPTSEQDLFKYKINNLFNII
jgi:hypothetical protein